MKIIIPMTGKSSRFKQAGIDTPKQFLKIENNYILQHIINMFPGENDINLIVNSLDLQNKEFRNYMMEFKNCKFYEIDFQKSGPGGALIESGILNTEDEVLINYCDFANIWDWKKFKAFIKKTNQMELFLHILVYIRIVFMTMTMHLYKMTVIRY